MNGGGKRQLPSWMLRSFSSEHASTSEPKGENKENGSEELDTKAFEPQMKVQRRKHDTGVPFLENKADFLKKCGARTRDRKSNKQNEDEGVGSQHGNEQSVFKQCRTRRSNRSSNKQGKDQGHDLLESDLETKVGGSARKRSRGNSFEKKTTKISVKNSHDGTVPSEDDLTVEDLVSIAEEYVNADKEKEPQKSQNLGSESETRPPLTAISKNRAAKGSTALSEERNSLTEKPLSSDISLTDALPREGSLTRLSSTGDPARDMLDLFLGPLLKKSEEVERKTAAMAEKAMFDHELSKRSQKDTVTEMVRVTKKKASIKDKVAMLLD